MAYNSNEIETFSTFQRQRRIAQKQMALNFHDFYFEIDRLRDRVKKVVENPDGNHVHKNSS